YLHGEDWKKIKNALETVKCPVNAKQLGITKEQAIKAMLHAKEIKPERYTIIEHINLDRKIAEHALKETEII
ncbi:MAG: NAD(P)-dependent glycerol-1-phosphate dehydrogenase, partial [Candidatus Micrarchaeota archaeon]